MLCRIKIRIKSTFNLKEKKIKFVIVYDYKGYVHGFKIHANRQHAHLKKCYNVKQKHTFPTENEKITAQSMTVAHGQINVQNKHNCL